MKNIKKTLSLMLIMVMVLAIVPTQVGAATFTENGITYTLNDTTFKAEVTSYSNSSPKDVTIPNSVTFNSQSYSVTSIGNNAFRYKGLTSVTMPDSINTIGIKSFEGNQLTSVTIPNNVTTIGTSAFESNQITELAIPANVTTIGDSAFASNQITELTIPEGVTTVGKLAFHNNQMTSVVIPESMTSISYGLFDYNFQLTSITIPNSVTRIEDYAFNGCKLAELTLPNNLTYIGKGAFRYNSFTNVVIPDTVTSIGLQAFSNSAIKSITIPTSVTSIGDEAFSGTQLENIYIPNLTDMDSTIALLTPNVLKWMGNNTYLNMYALDDITGDYTAGTLNNYTLNKGETKLLSVDAVVLPQVQRYNFTNSTWEEPIDENIEAPEATVKWYKKQADGNDIVVSTEADYTASETGVYYAKINDTIQLDDITITVNNLVNQTGNVIIKYVDQNGNELSPSEKITGIVGSNYTTNAKSIPNYELVKQPSNGSGKYTVNDTVVTYEYKPINNSGAGTVEPVTPADTGDESLLGVALIIMLVMGMGSLFYKKQRQ